MIEDLKQAGFLAVEAEGEILHARLWSSSIEFTATPVAEGWELALQWPVRASEAQLDAWNAEHSTAPMDLYRGETRLRMTLPLGDAKRLPEWAAMAEKAVATCIRWRKQQRAPGEGM